MELMVIAFPVGAGAVGIALGWLLAARVSARLAWGLCALLLAGAVALVLAAQGQIGFDGLGRMIVAVLMLVPAGLGIAVGVMVATNRARRG